MRFEVKRKKDLDRQDMFSTHHFTSTNQEELDEVLKHYLLEIQMFFPFKIYIFATNT